MFGSQLVLKLYSQLDSQVWRSIHNSIHRTEACFVAQIVAWFGFTVLINNLYILTGPTQLHLWTLQEASWTTRCEYTNYTPLYNMHGSWWKGGFHTSYILMLLSSSARAKVKSRGKKYCVRIAPLLPSHHTGPANRNLHSSISREAPLLYIEVLRETDGYTLMGKSIH